LSSVLHVSQKHDSMHGTDVVVSVHVQGNVCGTIPTAGQKAATDAAATPTPAYLGFV
jgi:hypothetical protein